MAEKLIIDGIELEYRPGASVLEHAREEGIYIPTLCFMPNITPLGSCRICVVEDEKRRGLVASCVTPAAPGMVINTRSERVLEARRNIIRLLLASHPEACVVCDEGNRCELRKLATELMVGLVDLDRIAINQGPVEVNPYIERDLSKCILCGRCIRACHELVVEGVVDYNDRGFSARPATALDLPLEESGCTFCGTCVALCPTGALKEKDRIFNGTASRVSSSVCPYCGCGCAIELELRQERLVGVRNDGKRPEYSPAICARGRYGFDFVHSGKRLTSPLIRKDGQLVECDWEEALGFAARSLAAIKEKSSPDALAVLGSGKCSCEENYLFQKFARTALGTNNVDLSGRWALVLDSGFSDEPFRVGRTNTPQSEIEDCDTLLVIGVDPAEEAPVAGYKLKRAVQQKNARLILVERRTTRLTRRSSIRLQPLPGAEGALLAGLVSALAEEDLSRTGSVADDSTASEILQSLPSDFSLEKAEELTGVSKEEISKAIEPLLDAQRVGIVYGPGLAEGEQGDINLRALLLLADTLQSLVEVKVSLFVLGIECNTRGACDMGVLPYFLPGYRDVSSSEQRALFEKMWKSTLPEKPGLSLNGMLQAAQAGDLKGMLITAENPMTWLSNPEQIRKAMESLELLVVVDLFNTQLAQLAHVVLPGAALAEKDGAFVAGDGTVRRAEAAISPPGEARSESWIVGELAEKLDRPINVNLADVRDEIAQLLPEYAPLAEEGFTFHVGEFADAKGRDSSLSSAEFKPPPTSPAKYPFQLIRKPELRVFGGGTRIGHTRRLAITGTEVWLEMNASDAEQAGLLSGDKVKVASHGGDALAMLRFDKGVMPGGCILTGPGASAMWTKLTEKLRGEFERGFRIQTCWVNVSKT